MKFPVSGSATLTFNSTSTFVEVTNAKRVMGGTTLASGRELWLTGFGAHLFDIAGGTVTGIDSACIVLGDAANGATAVGSPSGGFVRAMLLAPTMVSANAGVDVAVEFKPPGLKFTTECVVALANTTGVHYTDTSTAAGNVWGVGYLE